MCLEIPKVAIKSWGVLLNDLSYKIFDKKFIFSRSVGLQQF